MSHAATHWVATINPEDLTHGEFRVLFHLADCHNASLGCFPGQAYLQERTGLSNGGLNKALAELERKGLIRRERQRDEATNRQKNTRYILGFEMEKPQEPPPQSGDGAVSTFEGGPSPLLGGVRLHSSGDVYKDKPGIEPVREPCAAAPSAHDPDDLIDDFEKFAEAYPRRGDRSKAEKAFRDAVAAGATPEAIIRAAKAYAEQQQGNEPRFIAMPQNWLVGRRWEEFDEAAGAKAPADGREVLAFWADKLNSGAFVAPSAISVATRDALIASGAVTRERMRERGLA